MLSNQARRASPEVLKIDSREGVAVSFNGIVELMTDPSMKDDGSFIYLVSQRRVAIQRLFTSSQIPGRKSASTAVAAKHHPPSKSTTCEKFLNASAHTLCIFG
jgi:hypothetical protein